MERRGESDRDRREPTGRGDFSIVTGVPSNNTSSEISSPVPPGRPKAESTMTGSSTWYFRHPLVVRLTHWVNVLCLLVLSISGFQIYTGRHWFEVGRWHHYLFAWIFALNGFFFTAYAIQNGHLFRDLLPARSHLRMIGAAIRDYLLFRRPKGEEATRYNVLRIVNILQKLGYAWVVFGLGPLILLTGLVSSPRGEAFLPTLATLFGTRQRAKAIHFNIAILFIAYTMIHLFMVLPTGFWNNVRSMLTGWYRITPSEKDNERKD